MDREFTCSSETTVEKCGIEDKEDKRRMNKELDNNNYEQNISVFNQAK